MFNKIQISLAEDLPALEGVERFDFDVSWDLYEQKQVPLYTDSCLLYLGLSYDIHLTTPTTILRDGPS